VPQKSGAEQTMKKLKNAEKKPATTEKRLKKAGKETKRSEPRRETALYLPIKEYLETHGYKVKSEVLGIDVTAVKGDELVAVEMKLRFGLELLLQGAERQKTADSVYLAIPRPDDFGRSGKWRSALTLLKRLQLGLLLVSPRGHVVTALHPAEFDFARSRRMNERKRRSIIREIGARSIDGNTGGSTRRKLLTAYREHCIVIARLLAEHGPLSPKELIARGADKKAGAMLSKNYYGWFERVKTGVYAVSEKGRVECEGFGI